MMTTCSLGYCAIQGLLARVGKGLWRVEFDLNRPRTVILSRLTRLKRGGTRVVTIRRDEDLRVQAL